MSGSPAQPIALVTGGGRGIGREIALALAREGCHVVVAARSSDQVTAAAAAVAGLGVRALPLVLDVTDEREVARTVAVVAAELGPVDVLVNNAGVAESAPLAKTGKSFEEAVAAMARLNPGGRLIEPAEVAAVAAKLIRDESTNGEAIVLDGTQ